MELSKETQENFDKQRKEIYKVFEKSELLYTNIMLLNILEYLTKMFVFIELGMDRMGLPKVGQHSDKKTENSL